MAGPKFKPGDRVIFIYESRRRTAGEYEVVREIPTEGEGDRRYRVRSTQEPHERIAAEHELRAIGEG